jgi:transcriptional regulator with PAS, ATPase and Fis domain
MTHLTTPCADLPNQSCHPGLIGESALMHHLYDLIEKISHSSSPVLLLGETGTGKELVARAIHFSGLRRKEALVPVDCSSLTSTLIESELFGHVKGAFTGADHSKLGLLHTASAGTVFLDEIGELPMAMQAKLLRTLQQKVIRPVGSTEEIPVNPRVIAATNRNLEAEIRLGTFRMDLYFRLKVIVIRLPALRDHKEDIPRLVAYFLTKFSDPLEQVRAISDGALRRLITYDWPGNVRELENTIESALALTSSRVLTIEDMMDIHNDEPDPNLPDCHALGSMAETEHRAILHALRETGGNKIAAAHLLQIGKTTLYRKVNQYARANRLRQ